MRYIVTYRRYKNLYMSTNHEGKRRPRSIKRQKCHTAGSMPCFHSMFHDTVST
jgi:hypothetical protein